MNKKIRYILFALLALGLSVACTKGEHPVWQPYDTPEEIVLSAAIGVETRAIVTNATDGLQFNFARIDQNIDGSYPVDYSGSVALPVTRTYGNAGSAATEIVFTVGQYYLTRTTNNNTRLIGWYPRQPLTAGSITFDIDGDTDIMLSNELTGSKTDKFGTDTRVFTFSHLLTQIQVKAYADDPDGCGKILSIALKDQETKCDVTLPVAPTASAIAFSDRAATPLPLVEKDIDGTAIDYSSGIVLPNTSANAVVCGYAMIAPRESSDLLTLIIETANEGMKEVTLPAVAMEASVAYIVTLRFTSVGVTFTFNVTDWVDMDIDCELY